jgi:hypothetical protein
MVTMNEYLFFLDDNIEMQSEFYFLNFLGWS